MNFSVLISVYKNDKAILFDKALNSIVDQSLTPSQIVLIVDGQVPSEIEKIILKYEKLIKCDFEIIRNKTNIGLSKSLNKGIEKCKYELIARCDSDDIQLSHRFEKQMQFLTRNKDIDLVSSWVAHYDDLNFEDLVMLRKVPEMHNELVPYSKTRTPFNHPSSVFRKSSVIQSGCYPDITALFEDWWLAHRLISNGFKLYNFQEVLSNVYGGAEFFERRGGVKYVLSEMKNLYDMFKNGYFTFFQLLKNYIIRIPVRLLPAKLRSSIYHAIRKTT